MITLKINVTINQNHYSRKLMYEIKTEDIYEDFSSDRQMFDFSNYLTNSKYYSNSTKLVTEKMRDETGGVAIEEFVGLEDIFIFRRQQ